MPQVERVKSHKVRKYTLPVAAGVLGLVLAGAAVWFFTLPTPAAAAAKADKLNADEKYDEATRELKQAQWRAVTREDKALIVSRLAATSVNQGSLERGLKYYQELEQLDPQYSNIVSVAELAEQMERKEVARAAYERAKKAAEKLPERTRKDELPWLDMKIQELSK